MQTTVMTVHSHAQMSCHQPSTCRDEHLNTPRRSLFYVWVIAEAQDEVHGLCGINGSWSEPGMPSHLSGFSSASDGMSRLTLTVESDGVELSDETCDIVRMR